MGQWCNSACGIILQTTISTYFIDLTLSDDIAVFGNCFFVHGIHKLMDLRMHVNKHISLLSFTKYIYYICMVNVPHNPCPSINIINRNNFHGGVGENILRKIQPSLALSFPYLNYIYLLVICFIQCISEKGVNTFRLENDYSLDFL